MATPASPSYDATTYLRDRANIQDTLLKQVIYCDLRDAHRLETEVYAPECTIDYTVLFGGGDPLETTNHAWADAISNGGAHMVRKAAEGGHIAHNGGRMEYKMVSLRELEEKGENPWRIQSQKYTSYWLDGNVRVTDSMKGSSIA